MNDQPRRLSEQQVNAERDRVLAQTADLVDGGRLAEARIGLEALRRGVVDERTLELSDPWLRTMAGDRRVVASFDPARRPADDEVVIIYGNYPHMYENLVTNNPVLRHPSDFWKLEHDVVESDGRWNAVDHIYVINLDGRPDRYDSVLRELTQARAPLDRLTRIRASRPRPGDPDWLAGHLGCLRSHIEAIRSALDHDYGHSLVLEDDFTFIPDIDQHLEDLESFMERGYDYSVCLVATSKYGQLLPKDDLVDVSWQECTSTAGYLLSRPGAEALLPLYEDAHEQLARTGRHEFAADRCWAALQPDDGMLVFRRKWGYQVSSFSDIESEVSRNFD